VDELVGSQVADLCNHVREQAIGGNVEWHAKEDVRTTLVKLAGKQIIDYVELE
jgi:hypothetical protein